LEESNALDPELVGEVLSGDEDAAGEGTTTDA
jgi:ABC-type histidine transport system ATPase subunit